MRALKGMKSARADRAPYSPREWPANEAPSCTSPLDRMSSKLAFSSTVMAGWANWVEYSKPWASAKVYEMDWLCKSLSRGFVMVEPSGRVASVVNFK